MNRQKKQTIFLIGVLAVVVAVFLLFKYVIKFDSKEDSESTSISLWTISEDDVDYFSYTGTDGRIELTKENDKWILTGYENEEIDADVVSTCLGYVTSLSASEEIGTVENTADFGFDEPTNVITLKANGTTYKLIQGAYNSNISGYYIQVNDDSKIYVWSVSNYLSFENRALSDFIIVPDVSSDDVSTDDAAKEDVSANDVSAN